MIPGFSRSFSIRPYQPGDANAVRCVLEATYGEKATPQSVYNWWSFGCPAAYSGFMVAEAAGKIVGVQPMEIFPYNDGNKTLKGAVLTGVAVHPEFRRWGIFTALVKACESAAWTHEAAFVTTMPNERSKPGFLKLGYTDLGQRQLLVRPVQPAAMGAEVVPFLGNFAGTIAGCVQAVLKPFPTVGDFSFREASTAHPEISSLVPVYEALYPGVRMCRTPEWWQWRYLDAPTRKYRLIEASAANGKLAGVAVTTTDCRDRFRVCYLMDMVASDERVLAALLHQTCITAREDESHAVAAVVSSPALAEAIRLSGFWSVPGWAPVKKFHSVVRFNPAMITKPEWMAIVGWYQTLADWDNL